MIHVGESRRTSFFRSAAHADSKYRYQPLTWTGFGFGFDPCWQTLASPMAEVVGGAAEEWRRLEAQKDDVRATTRI